MHRRPRVVGLAFAAVLSISIAGELARAQGKLDSLQRERARTMLRYITNDIRKHYYDPKFHGVDLDARSREADQNIQQAKSLGDAFAAIAGMIEWFHDSHTIFLPPERSLKIDFGFQMQMVGDGCFITEVRPGTDAEKKLHIGDQVGTVEGFRTERATLWEMQYYFNRLSPVPALHLLVRSPDGTPRQVVLQPKMRAGMHIVDLSGMSNSFDIQELIRQEEKEIHLLRQRYDEISDALMIWKMPEFDLEDGEVDKMFDHARKHKTLILDLRGNPGGRVTTLQRMLGNVLNHEVKIADAVGRKETKPLMSKSRGNSAFSGKLIVLMDSRSASAAELFARTIQLEHRGVVIGDRSSGSVMESRVYPNKLESSASLGDPQLESRVQAGELETSTFIFFACAITEADLIMADGKSLEHGGVTPDEIVLPGAQDLAADRDPVLSRAATMAGVPLDPGAAGKVFPFEWAPN